MLTSTSYSCATREALHNKKVCPVTANIAIQMTLAPAQNAPAKKMWIEYMKEAEKYDNRAADSWKDDSNGLLVFVRPVLLIPLFIAMKS